MVDPQEITLGELENGDPIMGFRKRTRRAIEITNNARSTYERLMAARTVLVVLSSIGVILNTDVEYYLGEYGHTVITAIGLVILVVYLVSMAVRIDWKAYAAQQISAHASRLPTLFANIHENPEQAATIATELHNTLQRMDEFGFDYYAKDAPDVKGELRDFGTTLQHKGASKVKKHRRALSNVKFMSENLVKVGDQFTSLDKLPEFVAALNEKARQESEEALIDAQYD